MPKVNVFVTCLADLFYPEIAERLVTLLERLGCEVSFPKEQTCCGQPQINCGYEADARRLADHFLEVFGSTRGSIVAPFGSCVHALRHQYPRLYADQPDQRAASSAIAERTFDFCSYIVNELGISQIDGNPKISVGTKVAYHDECHMARGLGVRQEPLQLLNSISEIRLVEIEDDELCCGFGGSFSIKQPETSAAMADEKIDLYKAAGVETIVSTDVGCLMHLEGRIRRRGESMQVLHLLELLEPSGQL